MTEIVAIEKKEVSHLLTKRKRIALGRKISIINETNGFRFNPVKKNSKRRASPYMGTIFHARANKSHI